MAGYNYFPNYYSNWYQPQPQMVPQMQMPVVQQPVQPQPYQVPQQGQQVAQPMQQNGVVCVKSIAEVESWNVAPGNNQLFYIETTPPLMASKSKGFSPIENPVTKYYDLTERTGMFASQNAQEPEKHPEQEFARQQTEYAQKSDVVKLQRDMEALRVAVKTLNEQKPKKRVVEVEDDE